MSEDALQFDWRALLNSAKFWLALLALAHALVLQVDPAFPPDVMKAADELVLVVVGVLAAKEPLKARLAKGREE